MYDCTYVHMSASAQKEQKREGVRSCEDGIAKGSKLPGMGAGN